MPRPAGSRRALAFGAIAFGLLAAVAAIVGAINHFPRGLFVLALMLGAVAAAWSGLIRRGLLRVLALALAACLTIAALALLLLRDPGLVILVVVAAGASVACARAALTASAELDRAAPPQHPVLIFNPRSGGGKATRFDLANEALRRGIEPHEMVPGKSLEEMVLELLAGGADAVAVAGGDGSQATVAAVASREQVPYACIPAGTRNHFALDLGVDRDDVVGALDAFVDGGERIVDLAEVNGMVFVNNVSLGLYGDAVLNEGYRERKLRTIVDTIPEVTGPAAQKPPPRWHDPSGSEHDGGISLLVSNNVYRLGHAVASGTRPRLDAARLGVTVVQSEHWLKHGVVRRWAFDRIEVDGSAPIPAGIDGETVTLDPPLRFASRPGALRVRISRNHPGCSPSALLPEGSWAVVGQLVRLAIGRPA